MRANFIQTTVIATQRISKGNLARGVMDLRSSGALSGSGTAILRLIKTGVTAISNALVGSVLRRLDVAGMGGSVGLSSGGASGTTTVPTASSTVSADAPAGSFTITVASSAGFAAGDVVGIYDGDNIGLSRVETHKVVGVSGNVLTLFAPLAYDHLASQADNVRNKVDVLQSVVAVGSIQDFVLDYSQATTGDPQIAAWHLVIQDS